MDCWSPEGLTELLKDGRIRIVQNGFLKALKKN
jgi:hypothetical protein